MSLGRIPGHFHSLFRFSDEKQIISGSLASVESRDNPKREVSPLISRNEAHRATLAQQDCRTKGFARAIELTHRSDALYPNTDPSTMMARKHSIRIVIADDHPVVLQGLANLIASDPNFTLLASCPDGEQCVRAIRHFGPDIAVVDMTMPIMNGLEVLAGVIAERLPTRVVFLAASFKNSEIVAAAQGGAFGVMLKDTDPETVLHCLREVAAGRK